MGSVAKKRDLAMAQRTLSGRGRRFPKAQRLDAALGSCFRFESLGCSDRTSLHSQTRKSLKIRAFLLKRSNYVDLLQIVILMNLWVIQIR